MITFSQSVIVPASVMMRDTGEESVILDLKSEMYFGLDDVGTVMWHRLTESASIQAAYDALLEEYDVDPEILRNDVTALVEELVRYGLLTLSST